jgi:putative Holliday junction resolvase
MPTTTRLLAVDLGAKRTGLALSDELRLTARPLMIVEHDSQDALLSEIAAVIARYGIAEVVLGLPLTADGGEGHEAQKVRAFERRLAALGVRVITVDESGSSAAAQTLKHGKKSVLKSKRSVDAHAAKLILDRYLETL